ncbi:hypothetical protein APHMUC_0501 [Anaplasma phagocytophilum str. ApMUC09]|uniref:Uncharacterized protein n=1 Tax=Anaplasma phagocytophilum str. ApMUC09 TaxID=1359152 RepID=A0A0F3NBI1_ANAPH|nr:hypothetical protein APHMUC_0501 [Anaplasma phagocytophilum str. ApMUC09]
MLQRLNIANCISARIAKENVVHTYSGQHCESYVSVGRGGIEPPAVLDFCV